MKKKQKKQRYSWLQFERDLGPIVRWAKRQHFKNVYGIPRGGSVVAVRLSHLLNIPVCPIDDISRQTFVVDDIVDGGGTMKRFIAFYGNFFRTASIFLSPDAKFKPDFHVRERKRWVIFPWETPRTSRYDGTA